VTAVCASGHTSASDDFCEVCGMPITAGSGPDEPVASPPPPHHVPTQAPAPPPPASDGFG